MNFEPGGSKLNCVAQRHGTAGEISAGAGAGSLDLVSSAVNRIHFSDQPVLLTLTTNTPAGCYLDHERQHKSCPCDIAQRLGSLHLIL